MKKVASGKKGASPTVRAVPIGTVSTVAPLKLESRPQTALPTPVWSRYVDSRLKQFCLR